MKPFSLTTVLRYRKQLLDSAATRLAQAQASHHKILIQFTTLQSEYHGLVAELANDQRGGMIIEKLLRYEDRLYWLNNQIATVAENLKQAEKKVQTERVHVLKKSRDKKILEQLKEKQDKDWKQYLNKKEMSQLDEIAVLSHERKKQ